jgi:hypothetical protein
MRLVPSFPYSSQDNGSGPSSGAFWGVSLARQRSGRNYLKLANLLPVTEPFTAANSYPY